jgi:ATP adenylyltransferase
VKEERLWAPWRLAYIAGDAEQQDSPPEPKSWQEGANPDCFLCRAAATYDDDRVAKMLWLAARGRRTAVVLNRYPYNNGHLLVAPLRHVGELGQLSRDEHVECMEWLVRLTDVLGDRLKAQGFNIGLNLGQSAGAGLPGHLHWHVVPRWAGDNSFMPVLADTRVIPQSLDALWEILVDALD